MDLRSLRHVVALSRHLNYTKAAEDLGMTQSALTRSIQAVEQRCGVQLFDRDRGGVHVTSIGREFVDRAVLLLKDAHDLELMITRSASAEIGQITFGMGPITAKAVLPRILSRNLVETPEVYSTVFIRKRAELLSLLVSGEIEFFILPEVRVHTSIPLNSTYIGFLPFSFLARRDHPLFSDSSAKISDYPLIVTALDSLDENYPTLSTHLSWRPHIILEDTSLLSRIAMDTDAVWFTSPFAAADEIARGLVRTVIHSGLPSTAGVRITMYNLARRKLSPQALRLRKQCQDTLRQLAAEITESEPPDRLDS